MAAGRSEPTSTTASTSATTLGPSPTAWSALGCYVEDPDLPILEGRVSKEGAAATSPAR